MAAFLDTSALVKHFVVETGSGEITALVESDTELLICELATIEGVSALSKKVRKGEMSSSDFRRHLRAMVLFLNSGRCEIIPIDEEVKWQARAILSTWALSHALGSLDALQLAAAVAAKRAMGLVEFYCADRRQLAAAEAQGFAVRNPGLE
ncbi:MAG: type II toxin-antitoxin system VapC family toxin [Planctomycetes bacterium]|nr:type II toxin-antitoxin system VapC family toxin [Planctomycetota bacterium]